MEATSLLTRIPVPKFDSGTISLVNSFDLCLLHRCAMCVDACVGRWWFPIELSFKPSMDYLHLHRPGKSESPRIGPPFLIRNPLVGRGIHFTSNERHFHPHFRSSGCGVSEIRFPRFESLRHNCSCDACGLFTMGIEAVVEGDGGEERPKVLQKCVG